VELVGNRILDAGQEAVIRDFARDHALTVAGIIPFDPAVTRAGVAGKAVAALRGSIALHAIGGILDRIYRDETGEGKNL
jgi:CO dehydrogenase maturation factor